MGSWGFTAHESDTGLDAMGTIMDYGMEHGGTISLDDAMKLLGEQKYMIPAGVSPDKLDADGYPMYSLYTHEFTALALAEALIEQGQKGTYSECGYSDNHLKITYTAENLEFLKGEVDRMLNGDDDVTAIGKGWFEPEKWLEQTCRTQEQLNALKPSILAQLQEGKKAARESAEPPKDAPKRDSDREV